MRPDREEMLGAVRRALVEYVAGEVSSVYARTELTYALNLLAAIARESEDGVSSLVAENARLRRLFHEAAGALRDSPLIEAGLRRDLEHDAVPPAEQDLRLSSLRGENSALLETFIRLQSACEDALEDPAVTGVYRSTLEFLRARVDSLAGIPRRG